jgi:hypothetical protein
MKQAVRVGHPPMYLAQAMSFGTYQAILENAKSF